jgi:protein-tyrosine phosphatase
VGRPSSHSTSSNSLHASNPFFDAIRQNTELSHGITERVPLQLPKRVRRRIRELPFPWLQDIAKCAAPAPRRPRTLSDTSTTSDSESGDDSDIPNATEIEEGKEALAAQFYKVELAEQKRLMGIMEHHSRESGHATVATGSEQSQKLVLFPFSITAGVEKGAKNR